MDDEVDLTEDGQCGESDAKVKGTKAETVEIGKIGEDARYSELSPRKYRTGFY
jgi:hypothetical protein